MNGIKISYGNQTKRISETISTYDNLLQIVKKLYSLEKSSLINENANHIHLYYIDKDQEKIEVASQEDFTEVIKYHQQSRENTIIKLELLVNYLKDSIFIDQMLDDVKMSESFAVIDKRDIVHGEYSSKNHLLRDTKLDDGEFDLQASAVSDEIDKSIREDIKEEPVEIPNQEKGVQIETFCVVESKSTETEKVQTAEVAENTNILKYEDGCVQYEVEGEENSKKEEENKSDESLNEIPKQIISEISDRDKNVANMPINLVDSQIVPNNPQLDDLLVKKIDYLITNRLSLLETNFKKMLDESQMQSKIQLQNQIDINPPIIQNLEKKDSIKKKQTSNNFELTSQENIIIINKEQKKTAHIEIDDIKPEIEIKSQVKPEKKKEREIDVFLSLSESPNNIKQNANNNYHFNDYCSICKFQILKNKYVCLICDNFILCSQCESNHLEHALMKVNVSNKTITNKEELEEFFKQQRNLRKNIQKKGGFFNNLGKMFKNSDYEIQTKQKSSTTFAMPKDYKLTYTFGIENKSNKRISEDLIIYPKNNKNFHVAPVIVNSLEINEHKEIEIILSSPKELGTYEFEITGKINEKNLVFYPLKLQVIVTNPDDTDEANANFMFGEFEEIMQLPKEKRITLYNLISGQVVKKDFKDILTIMRKHDYDIDEALNDLMEDDIPKIYGEKNRNYNYTDIQYY